MFDAEDFFSFILGLVIVAVVAALAVFAFAALITVGGIGGLVNEVDIVMLCPHLAHNAKDLAAKYPDKPFYVIPTRLYGLMSAEDFYEDAQDAIAGWKETGMNPFHFEGEQTAIRVMRTVSHRKAMAKK